MTKLHALLVLLVLPLPALGGCISHEVRIEPITLQPIHMTLDVNLHVDHDAAEVTQGSEAPPAPSSAGTATPPAS